MQPFIKHISNPVINLGAGGEWDDAHVYESIVIKDGSTYKMWYSGHDGTSWRIGYATSSDEVSWTKQGMVLDLGSNGEWDDLYVYAPTIIKDGSTYKMWYTGHDGTSRRIGYATSSDGVSWTKQGMVLDLGTGGEWDDVHVYAPTIIKDGSTYKMWYTGHDGSNPRIGYATSSDGVSWTKQGMVLDLGSNGEFDDAQIYAPTIIKDESTYKMWYTGHDGTSWRIGYAISSDGVSWTKQDMVLDLGTGGEWDDVHVSAPTVIKDGPTYKMWYTGSDVTSWRIGYATSTTTNKPSIDVFN